MVGANQQPLFIGPMLAEHTRVATLIGEDAARNVLYESIVLGKSDV